MTLPLDHRHQCLEPVGLRRPACPSGCGGCAGSAWRRPTCAASISARHRRPPRTPARASTARTGPKLSVVWLRTQRSISQQLLVGEAEVGLADRHQLAARRSPARPPGAEGVVGVVGRALAGAALGIHQHAVERQRRALPFVPQALGAAGDIGAVAALEHDALDAGVARRRPELLQLVLVARPSISGDRSVRGGRTLACQASSRARRSDEGQCAQVLAVDERARRRGGRAPGTARAASCDTPLRLRRCCRSLNGATSAALRSTSSSPSSTASKLKPRDHVGKALADVVAGARIELRLAARRPRSARGCRPISIRRRTRRGRAPPSRCPPARCDSISGRNTGALETSGLGARPSSQANSGS